MNELVFLKNNQALTTSRKVAEYFEKDHKHVIRDIETLIEQMAATSQSPNLGSAQMFTKTTYRTEECGRHYPMYLLNRDGFTLLAMGFTGQKALKFKLNYIQAFNAMEQILLNHQNERWQELRGATKAGYKDLSAAVKELYEWAVSHGCKAPEKTFYQTFAKLMNKILGINPASRDTLSLWQLFEIEKLQFIAQTIIAGLLAQGADYHQPYRDCKSAFESYARLSFINRRFLK